jgi:hypothetical protein
MKKIFLNESEKKKLISEKEKMIIESFAKTFNKIKRIDENEINEPELNNGTPDLNDADYIKELLNIYLPHNVGEAFPYGEGNYTFSDRLDEITFTGELLHEDASIYNYDLGKFTKKVNYKFKFTYEIVIKYYPTRGDYASNGEPGEISLNLKEAFIITQSGKIIDVKKYVMDKSLKPLEHSINNIFWDEYIKKYEEDGEPNRDYDNRDYGKEWAGVDGEFTW